MKTTHHIVLVALVAMTVLVPDVVHAHGDESHAAKPLTCDASTREHNASGCGGDPKKVSRTIHIDMRDTMRFVVTNSGARLHEMVVGTADQLKAHADANMTHVRPGEKGDIVWRFTSPGEFQFACLIPGHFEAGMVGKVLVK